MFQFILIQLKENIPVSNLIECTCRFVGGSRFAALTFMNKYIYEIIFHEKMDWLLEGHLGTIFIKQMY